MSIFKKIGVTTIKSASHELVVLVEDVGKLALAGLLFH